MKAKFKDNSIECVDTGNDTTSKKTTGVKFYLTPANDYNEPALDRGGVRFLTFEYTCLASIQTQQRYR